MTDEEILKKIGIKVKDLRVARNIKQSVVAEKNGLSSFSLSQLENGHNISVLTLVKVLRAFDRLDLLEPFMTPPEIDPALLEEFIAKQNSRRKRICRKANPES